MDESLGPMLTRVRLARGWSQLRVAALLCAASGTVTVTRNEVSRWEREERVPSRFWLGWLALVLEVRIEELAAAAARTRRRRPAGRAPAPAGRPRLAADA
jgi:transcriptional regulator with XRE-family HTH domain